jgi:hypothetical protein
MNIKHQRRVVVVVANEHIIEKGSSSFRKEVQ